MNPIPELSHAQASHLRGIFQYAQGHMMNSLSALQDLLGRIDIYLLDQVLKGRIHSGMRILDAGCGQGRNLVYFLRLGYPVAGFDPNPEAVAAVRELAAALQPTSRADGFRQETAEANSFDDGCADLVISNAVLHFSRDHQHFRAQVDGLWRLLAPGGLLFARLASSIGLGDRVRDLGGGRFVQPDGSTSYLVDLDQLVGLSRTLGGRLMEPIKTTNVQDMRCMTTWVLEKPLTPDTTEPGQVHRTLNT